MKRLAGAAALLLSMLAPAPAGAQVPPPPEQAAPVFELVAPVGNAACGNAVVVVALGPAIVAGQLGMPLPLNVVPLFGPAVVLCGAIPAPPARLECAADDNIGDTVNSVTAGAAGLLLPIDPSVVGPVVSQIIVVEDNFPPPLDTAGLGDNVTGTLDCTVPDETSVPPDGGAAPPGPDESSVEDFENFETFSLPDLTLGDDLSSFDAARTPRERFVEPPLSSLPVAGVGPTGFAYPVVFGLPLVMLLVGGYLGRTLTQPVDPPQH